MTSIASAMTMPFLRQNPFTKIDTDQNGKVTRHEFVDGRPKDISQSQAADLYASIDTEGTGSVTSDQLKAGMAKNGPASPLASGSSLSNDVVTALMSILQQNGGKVGGVQGGGGQGKPLSDDTVFDAMDTDKDGTVSQAEFLAARPDGASEDQATSLFGSIDTEDTGSITKDQFAASRQDGPGETASSVTTESLSATSGDAASSLTDALSTLMSAIKAYAGNNNIATRQLTDLLATA